MNPETRRVVSKILEGRYFSKAVDLGCGEGYYGDLLKTHVDYLIGVDHNLPRLRVAKEFACYDEVTLSEIREYTLPVGVEAVFMLDSIEHLPKKDGFDLLLKLRNIPFVLISTPTVFTPFAFRNDHQSLWTESEFIENGFNVTKYNRGITGLFGESIIAWR